MSGDNTTDFQSIASLAQEPLFATVMVNPAGSDTEFDLHFNGFDFALAPGQTFDFTTGVPGGVEAFTIDGIDPFEQMPIAIPEPCTSAVLIVGIGLYLGRRRC